MIVKGLNGVEYKLGRGKRRSSCSNLHKRARDLIKLIYPGYVFCEEVSLPGTKTTRNNTLYADFLCHRLKLIVEVHGEQHYNQTYFHKTKADFIKSKVRDQTKLEWAEINGFKVIILPYNEDDDEWKKRLMM